MCHDGFYVSSSIWVLYFLVIKVKMDDMVIYIKFLYRVPQVFYWHTFWKDILCGNSYVVLSVLMTKYLQLNSFSTVSLLLLWCLCLELSQTSDIFREKKLECVIHFHVNYEIRKHGQSTLHLMNLVRLSDISHNIGCKDLLFPR